MYSILCDLHACAPEGDAIAMNLPMTVEAVTIYLGIVLAGCAVVSIADSFAADEVGAEAPAGL